MISVRLFFLRLRRLSKIRPPIALAGQVGWVAIPFVSTQIARLGTSIVLARLLAPELFGLMLVVNTLRMGAELLSDIGIGQSVVLSPNAEKQRFLNVAWTLQVLRGLGLTLIMLAFAAPIAHLYAAPELFSIIIAISPVYILAGLQSPGLFIMQRNMLVKKRAAFDVAGTFFQCGFTIALAWIIPSIWALVLGLIANALFNTLFSYAINRGYRPSFAWDLTYVSEILKVGKWIFLSTAVYFAAISFDRMFFVGVLPIALAGVYGIARTFSDLLGSFAQHIVSLLVFPKIAGFGEQRALIAPRVRKARRLALTLVALATAGAVAVADQFILIAYDQRYHAAAFMIPILMMSAWFSILSAFSDSMLMGCGRPGPGAKANIAKFVVLLIGLPLAVRQESMIEALLVLICAEMARWLTLMPAARHEGFLKIRDDLALTGMMLISALAIKFFLGMLTVVPTLSEWWALKSLTQF